MGNRIQLTAPFPRIMHGDSRANRAKLNRPPSEETILKASEVFSGYYDEWMKEHHAIATEMLRKYRDAGHIGNAVAEVGCGTGVLTSMLILERQRRIFKELAQNGKLDQPLTFTCLDFSERMLKLAKGNILKRLKEMISDVDTQRVQLRRDDFGFGPEEKAKNGLQQLIYRDKPLITVRFECKDASELDEVKDSPKPDTLILSYVMHWFRGLAGKLKTLQELHDVLPVGGKVISIEEYPLVVRCDLHPEDQKIQDLADMIEDATSVVLLPHMRELFVKAGFTPQDEVGADSALDVRIDEYHVMYGQVYVKKP